MWELAYKESWVPKNWCFWTVVLGLLRVPRTPRRSNQDILKEISPEYPLEGLRLKPKLQYLASWCEERTLWKRPWCWERLKVRGEVDDRGWDGWTASPTQWTWVRVSSGSWWWTGKPGVLQSMGSRRVRHNWATKLNWGNKSWNVVHKIKNFINNILITLYGDRLILMVIISQCMQINHCVVHLKLT